MIPVVFLMPKSLAGSGNGLLSKQVAGFHLLLSFPRGGSGQPAQQLLSDHLRNRRWKAGARALMVELLVGLGEVVDGNRFGVTGSKVEERKPTHTCKTMGNRKHWEHGGRMSRTQATGWYV